MLAHDENKRRNWDITGLSECNATHLIYVSAHNKSPNLASIGSQTP
jgi:hypothetical protein